MKRVLYVDDNYGGKSKYVLQKEYGLFGIYQRMCPSGYLMHQDYLVANDSLNLYVMSQSYNNLCLDEMYDMIDNFLETEKLNQRVITRFDSILNKTIKIIHPSGKEE